MHERELSGAQLEQYENGNNAPISAEWRGSDEQEQLRRYDDEEVVTKPWPPQLY